MYLVGFVIRSNHNYYDYDDNHGEDKIPAPSNNSVTTVELIGHKWLTRSV